MKPLIVLRPGFCLRYDDEIFCVDREIHLKRGQVVLISGASGSGKSSLLALIQNLIPAYIPGHPEGRIERDAFHSVYLFQNPYTQIVASSVREEFVFTMENERRTREFMQAKLDFWSQRFGFAHILNQPVHRSSGGQCQKVVLSSLLATDPGVILLDEPTAFIDQAGEKAFYDELLAVRKRNPQVTIVIVEHKFEALLPLVDVVWVLDRDRRLQAMSVEDFAKVNVPEHRPFSSEPGVFSEQAFDFTPDGLPFVLRSGEILCVMGPNGVGKTTLLLRIAQRMNARVAYVGQNPESHFFTSTVREDILQHDPGLTDEDMLRLLHEYGLPQSALQRSPLRLSEGEKRRLTILFGELLNRPIILYDEPNFGQDRSNRHQMQQRFLKLKRQGTVQIIVTHDCEFAKAIGDRCYELRPA